MKITLTGSLGNISKPLTKNLVKAGHSVTVISSSSQREKGIETLGAKSAIGSLEDINFLTKTFKGADAVYCMTPDSSDEHELDFAKKIAENYKRAVEQSGVKYVVHLSGYGAEFDKGTGPILGRDEAEAFLNKLPEDVAVTHVRSVYIYYNLNNYVEMIKNTGAIPRIKRCIAKNICGPGSNDA